MQCSAAPFPRRNPPDSSGLTAILAAVCATSLAGSALGGTSGTTNSPAEPAADPVLSLMLEKGMITEDEANKVQAQVDARRTNMAAAMAAEYAQSEPKWIMSPGIKDLELYGDIRLRYEDREATDPGGFKNPHPGKHGPKDLPDGVIDLARVRYALRFGLRGDAYDDFYYGFRLETASNPRSDFVTAGSSTSGNPYYGPFGRSTAGVGVGQLYLGWRPESWFDISVGKMPNPLYTTTMVWSPTISPEGAAEHLKSSVGPMDFFATFAQFLYADSNPNSSSSGYFNLVSTDGSTGNLPWLVAYQGGMDIHATKQIDFKVAPALYTYTRFNYGNSPKNNISGYTRTFPGPLWDKAPPTVC